MEKWQQDMVLQKRAGPVLRESGREGAGRHLGMRLLGHPQVTVAPHGVSLCGGVLPGGGTAPLSDPPWLHSASIVH